jgi:hypothetical protein
MSERAEREGIAWQGHNINLSLRVKTKRAPDQAYARRPLWREKWERGKTTLLYAVSFRSATELTWGIKMGARQNIAAK